MSRRPTVLLLFAWSVIALGGFARAESRLEGDLPRRAELGFAARTQGEALLVTRLEPGSAAARAGLADGDRIVAIDGRAVDRPFRGRDLLRRLDGDRRVALTVERAAARREIVFTPPPLPLEQIEGLDLVYGDLATPDGARLRTVASRPQGANGRLPAILLAQWVSCDGIEPLSSESFGQVIREVARRSGALFFRVERSSGGDSEGPGCHELDYETEVSHYRYALDRLLERPDVDRRRVVVYGTSLGSTVAPLLAAERSVAGVVVSGGGGLTYFERLLAFDRLGFERGGTLPAEIDAKLRRHAEFLVEYLLRGRDPRDIAAAQPPLAAVWGEMRGTSDELHYGRPFAWHRQLARRDLAAAWSRIEAPVLVVAAEHDQFEPLHALLAPVTLLERLRPGQARAVVMAGMNHFYDVYSSAQNAYDERYGHPAPQLAAVPILDWLQLRLGFPVRP